MSLHREIAGRKGFGRSPGSGASTVIGAFLAGLHIACTSCYRFLHGIDGGLAV